MILKVKDLKDNYHPLAARHPMMSGTIFETFKDNIKEIGIQTKPLVFKGQILDGRNRIQALSRLNIEEVECEVLDDTLSDEQLRNLVVASETRRHNSVNAKVLIVLNDYYYNKENGIKVPQKQLSKRVGVSDTTVSAAKWLWENGKRDMVLKLANDANWVERIGNDENGKFKFSNRLEIIRNYYKEFSDINSKGILLKSDDINQTTILTTEEVTISEINQCSDEYHLNDVIICAQERIKKIRKSQKFHL